MAAEETDLLLEKEKSRFKKDFESGSNFAHITGGIDLAIRKSDKERIASLIKTGQLNNPQESVKICLESAWRSVKYTAREIHYIDKEELPYYLVAPLKGVIFDKETSVKEGYTAFFEFYGSPLPDRGHVRYSLIEPAVFRKNGTVYQLVKKGSIKIVEDVEGAGGVVDIRDDVTLKEPQNTIVGKKAKPGSSDQLKAGFYFNGRFAESSNRRLQKPLESTPESDNYAAKVTLKQSSKAPGNFPVTSSDSKPSSNKDISDELASIENTNKIEELHTQARIDLRRIFAINWNKLNASSQQNLVDALVQYSQNVALEKKDIGFQRDYSSVCRNITTVLEDELRSRFYDAYRSFLAQRYQELQDEWPRPLRNKDFNLGAVCTICSPTTDKDKRMLYEYISAKWAKPQSKERLLQELEAIAKEVDNIRANYRNSAAHSNNTSRDKAVSCFKKVIGEDKVLIRILNIFKE